MSEQPSTAVQGYIVELKAQVELMSDRAAQYCAELADTREQIQLLEGRIKSMEEADAANKD